MTTLTLNMFGAMFFGATLVLAPVGLLTLVYFGIKQINDAWAQCQRDIVAAAKWDEQLGLEFQPKKLIP